MTAPGTVGAEVGRRLRLAWRVCSRSARYVARNADGMGWRDAVFVAVVTAVFLTLALFAPEFAPGRTFRELSPHGPVGVR